MLPAMARKPQPLKSIRSLVLLGAGKMGSAMLEGWLARGLNPKKITVLEPQPNKAVKALTRRGLKLNPKGKAAPASVIVVAVKPQIAADAVPLLAAYVGKGTLMRLHHGRAHHRLSAAEPAGQYGHRARDPQYAGGDRPRHQRRRRQRQDIAAPAQTGRRSARRHRRRRMGRATRR